jgi:hypothetical protein
MNEQISVSLSRDDWVCVATALWACGTEYTAGISQNIQRAIAAHDRQEQFSRKAAVLAEAMQTRQGLVLDVDVEIALRHLHDFGWDLTEIEKG